MRSSILMLSMLAVAVGLYAADNESPGRERSVPILYTTDLYHPHADPDDHYDLATLFAIPEFDIRAIVLDLGEPGANRPGFLPLQQMMHLTGREVPVAAGLVENLTRPEDTALEHAEPTQAGVRLILETLRTVGEPITVFTTGSLRDVAAAFNREPQLLKEKIARLYINVGHSGGGEEYNVKLDPHAYVRILKSDLPVYWVPCFGADGYESLWQFRQGDVLESAPAAVQNFFLYALLHTTAKQRDPIEALGDAVDGEAAERFYPKHRKMWCTGAFLHAAGSEHETFSFKPLHVTLDEQGITHIVQEDETVELPTFHIDNAEEYPEDMRETLRDLFARLPQ